MAAHPVCPLEELPPGSRRLVQVKGRDVALFNVDGELFAVLDRCPHAGASLYHGQLTGLMCSAGPGDYRLVRQGEILRCPWHRWEFDLRTGRSCAEPDRLWLRTFDVSVAGAAGPGAGEAGAIAPPSAALAATVFPVTVADSWVVIEA